MKLRPEQRRFFGDLLAAARDGRNPDLAGLLEKAGWSPVAGVAAAKELSPLYEWKRLAVVADDLGVAKRTLERWCAGGGKYEPVLPHRSDGRFLKVQTAVVCKHLRQYEARLKKFKSPAGCPQTCVETDCAVRQTAGPIQAQQSNAVALPEDPEKLLEALASPEVVKRIGLEAARVIGQNATQLLRARAAKADASSKISVDEAVKMLDGLAEVWRDQVHETGARRCALRLLVWLRSTFSVDLSTRNPSAAQMLERELREEANLVLRDVSEYVQSQTRKLEKAK